MLVDAPERTGADGPPEPENGDPMAASFIERLAGAVLAAEALVLAGIVGWEVTALVRGEAGHVPSSIALIVILPEPGFSQTRATASLRRPVA